MSVRDDEDGRRGSSSQSAFAEVVGEERASVRECVCAAVRGFRFEGISLFFTLPEGQDRFYIIHGFVVSVQGDKRE